MKKKNTLRLPHKKSTLRGHKMIPSYRSSAFVYGALSVAAIIGILGFFQTILQAASLQYDSPKKLVGAFQTNVLGDDNEVKQEEKKQEESQKKTEDTKKEEDKKTEEQHKEETKKTEEQQKASVKVSAIKSGSTGASGVATIRKEAGTSRNTEDTQETELETTDGQKIKTKIEDDGTTKIEIEHGELKIKYVFENGQIVKKVEDDEGNEVDLDEDELSEVENEIENELGDDDLEISTKSGKPAIVQNNTTAETDFPLSVDVGTNQLIITTPNGERTVTVLPQQAIQNLLATGIVSRIPAGTPANEPVIPGGSVTAQSVIRLKVRNSKPVYEIEGEKTFKLFAFIPVTRPVTAVISAETGDLVTKQQTLLTNVIDLLSP